MNGSICFITDTQFFGGTEIHTLALVKRLIHRDFRIEFVQSGHDVYGPFLKSLPPGTVSVTNTNLSMNERSPRAIGEWESLLKGTGGGVLVLPKIDYGIGSTEFLKMCRGVFDRIYVIEHTLADPMPPKASRSYLGGRVKGLGLWWYKRKYDRRKRASYADRVIAVSSAVARILRHEHWYPARKVIVATNGVDSEHFKRNIELAARFREKWHVSPDDFVFGMVSRLDGPKGVDIAIKSFARMTGRSDKSVLLLICGEGPEEGPLRRLAAELGVAARVVFPGFVRDTREIFSAIDCLLLPSRSEALPLSLLEGMAAGCVPIVTRVGGMPEVVCKPSLGWVVEPENTGEVSRAMEEVLALGKAEMDVIRKNVVDRVRRDFDGEKSLRKILRMIASESSPRRSRQWMPDSLYTRG